MKNTSLKHANKYATVIASSIAHCTAQYNCQSLSHWQNFKAGHRGCCIENAIILYHSLLSSKTFIARYSCMNGMDTLSLN